MTPDSNEGAPDAPATETRVVPDAEQPAMMELTVRDPAAPPDAAPPIPRALAKCLRCGYQWFPRAAHPAKCPHCRSVAWDKPRVYQRAGKPAPQGKAKPRGAAFTCETGARAEAKRVTRSGRNSAGKIEEEPKGEA